LELWSHLQIQTTLPKHIMLALKCSALAIVGAASSDCLADASTEQLALVQRQASRLNQAASEDPRELSAKESEEAALSAMMELAPDNTIRVKSRQNMYHCEFLRDGHVRDDEVQCFVQR